MYYCIFCVEGKLVPVHSHILCIVFYKTTTTMTILEIFSTMVRSYNLVDTFPGVCSIYVPTGQQTYKHNIKAHRHFSNFYA